MKKFVVLLICILVASIIVPATALASAQNYPIQLTEQEQQWLEANRDKVFVLGLDPYTGMDYFVHDSKEKGYVLELTKTLEKDLGIRIKLDASRRWAEVFDCLKNGEIDILFGANVTPEREQYMSFTSPVNKYPYAIIAKRDGDIDTMGDLDNKIVGFMEGDAVMDALPQIYKNIRYRHAIYASQEMAVRALNEGKIDAFITAGGPVIYDYIYGYPKLKFVAEIKTFTSDMTLSTRKQDEVLAGILDKEIKHLQKDELPKMISRAEVDYYRKIMNLTEKETAWLQRDGVAMIGITKDYLPFDYYENEQYKGISGEIIKEISRITGIRFVGKLGDFDELYDMLKKGQIDVLNIAKTDERLKYFYFPRPYSTERDIIVGTKDSEDVMDIFGLEGKKVAVIKGFWHYEYLRKNLSNVEIIETDNIEQSMLLVHKHKADYLIENPTVVKFYTDELQLYDLVEKGVTSTDSYLYYGINKQKPELASIIDKAIPFLNIEKLSKAGYKEVPHIRTIQTRAGVIAIILGLFTLLVIIVFISVKLVRDLIKEKTEAEILRQREQLLFTDALTGVPNRNYFNSKVIDKLDTLKHPQSFILTDMNNLKVINDKYGHHAGDELLKLLVDIIREICPPNGTIIRMGGDEFMIILENTNESEAEALIENIREACRSRKLVVEHGHFAEKKPGKNQHTAFVQSAFGYATRYTSDISFDEVFRTADKSMYKDKRKIKQLESINKGTKAQKE